MKQVKIDKITFPIKSSSMLRHQRYCVALGNGNKTYFKKHRSARDFISSANKTLCAVLFDCNQIYTTLYVKFRQCWFYFEHDKPHMNQQLYEEENRINQGFANIDSQFRLIVQRSSWRNGNYLVFHHFKNIFETMEDIKEVLDGVYARKMHYIDQKELKSIQNQIDNLNIMLNSIGKTQHNKF